MNDSRPIPTEYMQVSVVVPTYNERNNIAILLKRVSDALVGMNWEIIFVDDASPDGTADIVRALARQDQRVRLISRHNRRGLSSAVVEGALAASADIVAVMDGDLQHDEGVLPEMYRTVASGKAEIASASRFLQEDGAAGLSSATRLKMSNGGIRLANAAFGLDLTDPLTGFFVIRRDVLVRALPDLSEQGFKILLDLITSAKPRPRVAELPFRFREREHGESKLDNKVMYDFFLFFLEKKIGHFLRLPARFLSFGIINTIGILLHLLILEAGLAWFGLSFAVAQLLATMLAMAFNYSVNNLVTYNDRQLKGADFYTGFVIFALLCSVGVVANVGIATVLHVQYADIAHELPALAGAMITAVWNYAATKLFVWGKRRRPVPQPVPEGASQGGHV
ncbi:glycosyltransferase family 2 protein [Cereibacter sp. SYSU M97828]|nr:glycosyltransferase family 2 protein [Cereibacter flavus]